jgi:hypothetical protein
LVPDFMAIANLEMAGPFVKMGSLCMSSRCRGL